MSNLNIYENKAGYQIRATSKAYELYYRKLGFAQVKEKTYEKEGLNLSELKKLLKDRGIPFNSRAKREELEFLLEQSEVNKTDGKDEDGVKNDNAQGVSDNSTQEDAG